MIEKMDLKEFRDSGMIWYINQQLHLFGMALALEYDDDNNIIDFYPVKCKFRGFSNDVSDKGYNNLTKYLKDNVDELLKDCE